MTHRIEVFTKVNDTRSAVMESKLSASGFKIAKAKVADVYTINKDFSKTELEKIGEMLTNPVSQNYLINSTYNEEFSFALEIGFLPGVTDNIAHSAKESIEDYFKIKFNDEESVHSSTLIFLSGEITAEECQKIASSLANDLIQRIHIKDHPTFKNENGMDFHVPTVHLKAHPQADEVNLNITEEELLKLSKEGILNTDGTRRGPLALEKDYLEAIKKYFEKEGRNPTDIELESLAQTWSEHCKHTIFAAQIDDNSEGLYKGFIKKATEEIRKNKGSKDFCVSVFSDNAGGIVLDENWVITDKAETHNSPSALDPFGGAITGIVGVNRDTIGFGKGAKPIINKYGFCLGNPHDTETIYRDKALTLPALSPKRIFEGVVAGVNSGGNCSGIPTPQGFLCFDNSYKGKPLIFVGTVGLIPRTINGEPGWEKAAQKGDKIVVIGGRVGQDGIHGATFSSEALTSGSPATAVQIGDPITQKKLSDAIVKEARDLNLYTSITDNGAGGISCSVAEMAKECGGCYVELEKVPLKYPNLEPWKIWISESQERMTLAVPPEKIDQFTKLMNKRGVEVSVIGEFTNSGRCQVSYMGNIIMDMEMEFLHNGLPRKSLKTSARNSQNTNPQFPEPTNLTTSLEQILSRPNICSYEFISTQYDHVVQGTAVTGPLQGKGRVNSVATVTRALPENEKGIVCSQGLFPRYGEIDTYHMASNAIDSAIRNVIAAGGTLQHLALMDNFCWCSSNEPERLGQLLSACEACYDFAVGFGTPYISGKDSMFNDFNGFDKEGNPIKISALPTLLISSMGVMENADKAISLDTKIAGDLIYVLGTTKEELGGSEYFDMHNSIGTEVPQVDIETAKILYNKFSEATEQRLIASALSPNYGGLLIALAKKAIGGQLGMQIDLMKVPGALNFTRNDYLCFSESAGRIVVSINPNRKEEFERHFSGVEFAQIGVVTSEPNFVIKGLNGEEIINTNIANLNNHYRQTFKNY